MNLVDEQHISGLQSTQGTDQIACLGEGGPGRHVRVCVHFIGDDVRERGFTEAGRTVKQDVLHRLAALLRRFEADRHALDQIVLPHIFTKTART